MLEKDKYYSQEGELFDYSTYEYNNKGENDKMYTYNSKGEITNVWQYKYDNYGNVITVANYNPQGKIIDKYSYHYVYDSKGNWISKKTYQYYIPIMITTREITYY